MEKMEFPAMIYKNNRNKVFVANCIAKNMVGFGKTEEDALENLKKSLKKVVTRNDFVLKKVYGLMF